MTSFTQDEINNLSFDDILKGVLSYKIRLGGIDNGSSFVFLLSLVTGLPLKVILDLKWSNILTLGSDNDAVVDKELLVRKYIIPIHPVIQKRISEYYTAMGFPNLNESISSSLLSKHDVNRPSRIASRVTILCYQFNNYSEARALINEDYPLVLFGKKVFAVNGYTNEIAKKLKLHFKLDTNQQLFDFLGYHSKNDIRYELSDINLSVDAGIVTLADKNFNNGSPFQRFDAFNKYLTTTKSHQETYATKSIKIILLISLHNGIRPSSLLQLNWGDVVTLEPPKGKRKFYSRNFHQSIVFKGKTINIPSSVQKMLHSFILTDYLYVPIEERESSDNFGYKGSILEQVIVNPTLQLFRMNNGNRITQPSLLREIKNALHLIGFPHTDKITTQSTVIMYGRKILEVKGDHPMTIKKLKEHFKYRSKKGLFEFLHINYTVAKEKQSIDGVVRPTIFDEILYDL